MKQEIRTIQVMIRLYCRARHGRSRELCEACARLQEYAVQRIEHCPFGLEKPVCNHCTVHCYQPEMRQRVQEVMRFAGPRMPVRHPLLAIRHLLRTKRYRPGRSK